MKRSKIKGKKNAHVILITHGRAKVKILFIVAQ